MDSNFPFNNPGEEEEHTVGSYFFPSLGSRRILIKKPFGFRNWFVSWWCENSISTLLFYTLEEISGNLKEEKNRKKMPKKCKNACKVLYRQTLPSGLKVISPAAAEYQ